MIIQAAYSLFSSRNNTAGYGLKGVHKGNWLETGCFYEITKNRDRKWDEKIVSASSQLQCVGSLQLAPKISPKGRGDKRIKRRKARAKVLKFLPNNGPIMCQK